MSLCLGHSPVPVQVDRLGQGDVLSTQRHPSEGQDDRVERGARPDTVHLLGQDRHLDPEHHDLQQVLHQWEKLW